MWTITIVPTLYRAGLLSLYLTGNILPTTQCCVAPQRHMKCNCTLILSLAKLRQNAEESLKTNELIICDYAYEVTNAFCEMCKK